MMANCSSCWGFESTFAPTSSSTGGALGRRQRRRERGTIDRRQLAQPKTAIAITAPVFPAVTSASAFRSRTIFAPTRMELSRFVRNA